MSKVYIRYVVYEIASCNLGDSYRQVLEFFDEKEAREFINLWYTKYDFNFTCLVLMKVLRYFK